MAIKFDKDKALEALFAEMTKGQSSNPVVQARSFLGLSEFLEDIYTAGYKTGYKDGVKEYREHLEQSNKIVNF